MKNLFLMLIVLFISINESQAQRNFGKRKFSRNLFSKNIGFNSKAQKEKGKPALDLKIENKKEIEVAEIKLNPIELLEFEHELEEIEIQARNEKPNRSEIKKVAKAPKFEVGISEIVVPSNFSTAIQKSDLNKNSQSRSQKNVAERSDFGDFLMDAAGWFLSAAICVGYLLLLHYFPVITAIVTLVLVIVGLIILINGIFDFFADFLSAMWH